ncbi:hypothetical protein [[Micrococcus luteus] ATCC 49442]|uniref:hypothetical protein n=1 Tax=[Micrococcus luteus] ATCC 49442 TaxID=2698727 RepID=UPI0013DC06B8|nr:hypothetical protein [[Micrococcus luteus] ATCC 49442]
MGVVLWYQVEFPDQQVTLSSDVYSGKRLADATVKVVSGVDKLTTFDVTFADLPSDVLSTVLAAHQKAGEGLGVRIRITLGYLDEPGNRGLLLDGYVDEITAARGYAPVGVKVSGHDTTSARLLIAKKQTDGTGGKDAKRATIAEAEETSLADMVRAVTGSAGTHVVGTVGPEAEDKRKAFARDGGHAFALLQGMAEYFGAELLLQPEGVQFGTAVRLPAGSPKPNFTSLPRVLAYILTEDTLVTAEGKLSARLAQFTPMSFGGKGRRVVDDRPDTESVRAFDFTVLGEPRLRAGQLVVAGVEGYSDPDRAFRILDLTHSFSPKEGYVCTGRAAFFDPDGKAHVNRDGSEKSRKASAAAVADRIKGIVKDAGSATPSVEAGQITASTPTARTASLVYRPDRATRVVSPSVQRDIPQDGPKLPDKPMASPFAWHNVGLSVPVYEGMRALLNQVRDSRDDSVVTGFLWSQEPAATPPESKAGDWWLCLPTEISGNPALPSGKGVNDLTAADGRRVIEAVGLSVTVGKSACTNVGKRPSEGKSDTFLITHSSGTKVQIDDQGAVSVDAGSQQLVLKGGGVTVTLADGKVSIS